MNIYKMCSNKRRNEKTKNHYSKTFIKIKIKINEQFMQ